MKKKYSLIMLLLVCLLAACQKFLAEKPDDKITTPQTAKDLWALMDQPTIMNSRCPMFDEASADAYFLSIENLNRVGDKGRAAYLWEPHDYNYVNEVARSSEAIFIANLCLETIEKNDFVGTPEEYSHIKGTALFFRAFYWLRNLWAYSQAYDEETAESDLGIIIRIESDFNVKGRRYSVRESYDLVVNTLIEAIELLPEHAVHTMRPSRAAAHALLARTYLSMRKYDLALSQAEAVLERKSDLLDFNDLSADSQYPFQSFNEEVIFHADVSAFSFFNINPSYAFIDTMLYDSYDDYDLRKKMYFRPVGDYYQFKGSYWDLGGNTLFTGLAVNEIVLIKAECLIRLGELEKGRDILVKLMRTRWDKDHSVPNYAFQNTAEALQVILTERKKELILRGVRWIDIKRLNKEGHGISLKRYVENKEYNLPANSEKFALPYPDDLVRLSGIEQNPGW